MSYIAIVNAMFTLDKIQFEDSDIHIYFLEISFTPPPYPLELLFLFSMMLRMCAEIASLFKEFLSLN